MMMAALEVAVRVSDSDNGASIQLHVPVIHFADDYGGKDIVVVVVAEEEVVVDAMAVHHRAKATMTA